LIKFDDKLGLPSYAGILMFDLFLTVKLQNCHVNSRVGRIGDLGPQKRKPIRTKVKFVLLRKVVSF